jgi:hypothetical protein
MAISCEVSVCLPGPGSDVVRSSAVDVTRPGVDDRADRSELMLLFPLPSHSLGESLDDAGAAIRCASAHLGKNYSDGKTQSPVHATIRCWRTAAPLAERAMLYSPCLSASSGALRKPLPRRHARGPPGGNQTSRVWNAATISRSPGPLTHRDTVRSAQQRRQLCGEPL